MEHATIPVLLPQITGSFKTLWPTDYLLPVATTLERCSIGFENLLFIVAMISLGAFFGNTFMTRLSALIERVHFLIAEWLRLVAM